MITTAFDPTSSSSCRVLFVRQSIFYQPVAGGIAVLCSSESVALFDLELLERQRLLDELHTRLCHCRVLRGTDTWSHLWE
jgi:hypothetical protein